MTPKHDEILRPQPGGWTLGWDATTVDPSLRKAVDKVIAENARALRDIVQGVEQPPAEAAPASPRKQRARAPRRARVAG